MTVWIVVALIGVILSLWGLWFYFRQYQRGNISGRYLAALVVGYLSFVSYAIVSTTRSFLTDGIPTAALLLPGFIAIVVIVRERRPGA